MSQEPFIERTIEVNGVRSLAWDDRLVDWVAGGHCYSLDGSIEERRVNYAYEFDASIVSPSGKYAVIFTSIGTKGVVLLDGEILCQLNRDFYHAHASLYPIAFAQLPNGREVVVHCPEHYCNRRLHRLGLMRSKNVPAFPFIPQFFQAACNFVHQVS